MASLDSQPCLKPRPHLLAFPVPAQGHITPLMRLCKTLAKNGFLITFVNADFVHHRMDSVAQKPVANAASEPQLDIRLEHIPLPGMDLANDFRMPLSDMLSATEFLTDGVEQLVERFAHEGTPVTGLISDMLLSTSTQKVADNFNIPRIALCTFSQSRLLLFLYLLNGQIPMKDAIIASVKRDNPSDLFCRALPGIPALRNVDLPMHKHIVDETELIYHFSVGQFKIAVEGARAIVVNSFDGLEGPAFEAMRKHLNGRVYGVGPLLEELQDACNTSLWKEEDECLEWLEDHPPQSVLYVSFGSFSLLSKLQFEELCAGLAASNQRFLWAFRPDLVEGLAHGSFPEDFLARTGGRGYVVKWAPQLRVLSHSSIGGFLTHCGWNSTVESVAKGVPMLWWPYFADQFLNAKYIVEEWKVGLRCEQGEGGVVRRGEVERVVRLLMEGEPGNEARKKAAQLGDAARKSQLEGGSSHKGVQALIRALSSRAPL